MTQKMWMVALLLCTSFALAGPKGTVPKSNALAYPAHAQVEGAYIGARLLSSSEARKAFTSEVNRCCVVVEVAVYPRKDQAAAISLNDFVLEEKHAAESAKPGSAKVIAASLRRKAQDEHDVTVSPVAGIGYGSGPVYDPVYGTTPGGITTTAGVGVGIGRHAQAGTTEKDLEAMETELSEKGLPEGVTTTPVAGHLYFSMRRNKNATYQLDYMLNGQKVSVTLN